jgi:amino acid adenylation domain-containing protein
LLEKAGARTEADRIPRRAAGSDCAPLSSGQRRLWFLDHIATNASVYNVPTCFRIRGPLDVDAFQQSLNEIVRRHEILRTTFRQQNSEPVQVIAGHAHVPVTLVDFKGHSNRAFQSLATDEARRPFDLAQGPLIRVALFRLAPEDHAALITMHHIVCDGWSMGVLFRELIALYPGFISGVPKNLPELPLQYADYAIWQHERFESGKLATQIEYWRQHLRGAPTVFELPADRMRPQQPSFSGSIIQKTASSTAAEALLDIARSEATTPFVVLLAAWSVLLHRYSGQNDSIVGCPVSNRNRSELEPMIGFLPNTLPLRVVTAGDPQFLQLVRNLRETTAQAFANAEAPFEAITDAVAGSRSGRQPLFQVAFMTQDRPPASTKFGDMEIAPVELDLGTAKCDLTLSASTSPDVISLAFEYSADLFNPDMIERMSRHFVNLLEGIAADPESRISELPLMSAREERQVLIDWSRTRIAEPDSRTLHEIFEQHAALHPAAPALVFGAGGANCGITTYAELNRRANRAAHALRESGAGSGALVAIALKRSPDLIAAILGVLKSGAAYLPLALDHPGERISFQIEDARPMMLLSTAADRQNLPPAAQKLEWLDVSGIEPHAPETNPPAAARGSDLAYVIYTSGSTGKPKGAMLEHRGLTNLALAQKELFELGAGTRILQFAAPTFDASVWEIAMALGSGGCLCLGSGTTFVPEELARVLREQHVTAVTLPPSLLRTIAPGDFPELKTVISAGEDCPETLARAWSEGRSFFNAYGPTEATVCATASRFMGAVPKITIGRPLANVRTYVLDANMRPVPAGVPGELHIGGAGVARGYLNRPDLTRERFVVNPFEGGDRLHKSGDLARYLANGDIEFLGRIDGQLKLRGHRIEPGEIEARLALHPAIRECAAGIRADDNNGAMLVAWFVPNGAAPDSETLRAFVSQSLPHYMTPSAFVALDQLPLNSSGKIDRRALAEMPFGEKTSKKAEARDELESRIAQIWAEVLRLDRVGVTDNFFELGGNSLMAVALISKVGEATNCNLPVTALFEAGTVEKIARLVRERRNSQSAPGSLIRLQPSGSKPPLVLIPPAGGSLVCYSEMARTLAPDQPVFGVEPPRGMKPPETVEAMAAAYIRQLDSASIAQPFQLGGWSFGGVVAFEMARQFADQGRPVDLVVLLDSRAEHKGDDPDDVEILLEIARVQALARGVEINLKTRKLRRLEAHHRAMFIAAQMNRESGARLETIATDLRTICQQFQSNMRAARRYSPHMYRGRVALVRASDGGGPWDCGWSRYCAQVEVLDVPGSHRTMIAQPHVATLAATLRGLAGQ